MAPKGTIAIEEAVLDPGGVGRHARDAALYAPAYGPGQDLSSKDHPLTAALLDIHTTRLAQMDAHGVEYMLLSLTSPGPQGASSPREAEELARTANDWLAGEANRNPSRFGALASLSMHDASQAAGELRRAVKDLGMKGVILNDFQSTPPAKEGEEEGKKYFDTEEYHVFWKTVEELDVPVYMHPRYATGRDLEAGSRWGDRKHLLGAGVQFHLDLSFHIYAICSSGLLDLFPKVQIVAGHLGEG
jgi:2,3-dihydroxybenzoate decarboxylase